MAAAAAVLAATDRLASPVIQVAQVARERPVSALATVAVRQEEQQGRVALPEAHLCSEDWAAVAVVGLVDPVEPVEEEMAVRRAAAAVAAVPEVWAMAVVVARERAAK